MSKINVQLLASKRVHNHVLVSNVLSGQDDDDLLGAFPLTVYAFVKIAVAPAFTGTAHSTR